MDSEKGKRAQESLVNAGIAMILAALPVLGYIALYSPVQEEPTYKDLLATVTTSQKLLATAEHTVYELQTTLNAEQDNLATLRAQLTQTPTVTATLIATPTLIGH